jgi:hypothetical protein
MGTGRSWLLISPGPLMVPAWVSPAMITPDRIFPGGVISPLFQLFRRFPFYEKSRTAS